MLSISEAPILLGVHPATIRQWHRDGTIQVFKTIWRTQKNYSRTNSEDHIWEEMVIQEEEPWIATYVK